MFEAVESRFNCRAFLDKPVDPALVRDLITLAARAASGGNLQPCRVHALTGAPLGDYRPAGCGFPGRSGLSLFGGAKFPVPTKAEFCR
jgi:hypothetical protein